MSDGGAFSQMTREELIRRAAHDLYQVGLFITSERTPEAMPKIDPTASHLMEETLSIVGRAFEKQGAMLSIGISEEEETMVRELRSVARHLAMVKHWENVSDKAHRIGLAIRMIDPENEVWEEIATRFRLQDTSTPFGNYIPLNPT